MKLIIVMLIIMLIFADIWNYISLRKYCEKYGTERLELHEKYIIRKLIVIVVIGILVGVLAIALNFV